MDCKESKVLLIGGFCRCLQIFSANELNQRLLVASLSDCTTCPQSGLGVVGWDGADRRKSQSRLKSQDGAPSPTSSLASFFYWPRCFRFRQGSTMVVFNLIEHKTALPLLRSTSTEVVVLVRERQLCLCSHIHLQFDVIFPCFMRTSS